MIPAPSPAQDTAAEDGGQIVGSKKNIREDLCRTS
jgi:hypothetical protein